MAAAVSAISALRLVFDGGAAAFGWIAFALGVGEGLGAGWGLIIGASSGASTKAMGLVVPRAAGVPADGIGAAGGAACRPVEKAIRAISPSRTMTAPPA
ncbi:hypothetical protein [Bradyrhizobium lablabi]|uniref:hypothetical protein n=1 Tax=Bradyrhizobium lablabi TaxID=722472 RepID=UPI001BADDE4F|nr:hypothetical protein [Bradyrhizobium lablabi]MBR0695823.1 hypothetical protein [Bradyrhizobium lablabi]